MSRAARTLGVAAAVVCCLASAVVTPVQTSAASPADATGTARTADTGIARADDGGHHHGAARAGRAARAARAAHAARASRDLPRAQPGPRFQPRPEARAPEPPERAPISIEGLDPSYLQPGKPVQVTGTVFNDTDDVWGDSQVGMLASSEPLTSNTEVAQASVADPYEEFPGSQILAPGTFDDIGDIAPGQSRSFTFAVPYRQLELSGSDGVYWVGAEIRVTGGDGARGSVARTLTFMPLVNDAAQAPPVDLAVLWPMTGAVPWDGEAFVNDSLSEQFAEGGRLRALAELGASAGDRPLSWLLDPAVLDAARNMSHGFTESGIPRPPDSTEARAAAGWLGLVRRAARRTPALAVPYAHPDVAALAHADIRPSVVKARRLGEAVLNSMGIRRLRLLWPPDGQADPQVLSTADESRPQLSLLARNTFEDPPQRSVVGVHSPGVPTSSDPRSAGSGSTDSARRAWPSLVVDRDHSRRGLRAQPGQSTLQWRQQILANTALRSLSGTPAQQAAVAMPAAGWWPDAAWRDAGLFRGLEVPWIHRVTAGALADGQHPRYEGGYDYREQARERELGPAILSRLRRLRRTGRLVNNLLADPTENVAETDRAFSLSASSAWRDDRATGRRIVTGFLDRNRTMVHGIELETPSFVTLSSNSGRFPLSVTNRLDEPVKIELAVSARDPRMSVEPIAPVTLQRDQRVTVTVVTSSRGVGITTLNAQMHTQEGRPFGHRATFQVRTTQIGAFVWVVIGVGAAVLFVAAARRILQRVRNHRRHVREAR